MPGGKWYGVSVFRFVFCILHLENISFFCLWRRVRLRHYRPFQKDSMLDIIQKFINLQKKKTLIFPRYHQLDVVRKLIADVRINGAGKNLWSNPAIVS